jgi:glycine/serine hydroxymethyltransferase
VFPGDVSNHHLGTLLALLGATYEMIAFRDAYQAQVIANAKAFAQALCDAGLSVEGDSAVAYTETHQVILNAGRGRGPEVARRLEENGVITNYQALPSDASFSDASGIRTGVQEMTRFGMQPCDFQELAQHLADIVLRQSDRSDVIRQFRTRFKDMQYCLPVDDDLVETVLSG